MDIFERLHSGEAVSFNDPEYPGIFEIVKRTLKLNTELNLSGDLDRIRELMGEITGVKPDISTTVFPPFYINLGIFTLLGKNVFINQGCSFLDIGGITIEDSVMLGPKVSVITEGHPLKIAERNSLVVKPVIIKRNAWIGAGAIILPGVTIGENSVIAAGAVVRNDVPANTVAGGVPARVIKFIV